MPHLSTFPIVSKRKTAGEMRRRREGLGEEGHAELHKKELGGDMRKGESHLGRDTACRGRGEAPLRVGRTREQENSQGERKERATSVAEVDVCILFDISQEMLVREELLIYLS